MFAREMAPKPGRRPDPSSGCFVPRYDNPSLRAVARAVLLFTAAALGKEPLDVLQDEYDAKPRCRWLPDEQARMARRRATGDNLAEVERHTRPRGQLVQTDRRSTR